MKRDAFFPTVIFIILLTDVSVLLNIPYLRQILGLFFLLGLPGLVIVRMLNLEDLDNLKSILLIWGISISFSIIGGLFFDIISVELGYLKPLSTLPLLAFFNTLLIIFLIIDYKLSRLHNRFVLDFNLNIHEKLILIPPILFAPLAIYGTVILNVGKNNTLLMLLVLSVSAYISILAIFNDKITDRVYPIIIFLISISLLSLFSFRSNYILGNDASLEYYVFKCTVVNMQWKILGNSLLDGCLSISILPTIYAYILNINTELLFKTIYSLFFSISPLIVFVIAKRYVTDFNAFLSSCFFMSQPTFLMTAANSRTSLAILFFGLSMMVLFTDEITLEKNKLLFIIFLTSCILSHYSTSYIFFILILFTILIEKILGIFFKFNRLLNSNIVLIFFIIIFLWNTQIVVTSSTSVFELFQKIFINLSSLFIEELKTTALPTMLGQSIGIWRIPKLIHLAWAWLTIIFACIGIGSLLFRFKEMTSLKSGLRIAPYLRHNFEVEYFCISAVFIGIWFANIVLPYLASSYSLERAYTQSLVIMAIFFVIGGIILSNLIGKANLVNVKDSKFFAPLIILIVLIPYFLCTTGFLYNLFGYPESMLLNSEGSEYELYYIHDQEEFGAKWLDYQVNPQHGNIYTDSLPIANSLNSYGYVPVIIKKTALINNRINLWKYSYFVDNKNKSSGVWEIYDNGNGKILISNIG